MLNIVNKLRTIENDQRKVRLNFANLYSALKFELRIKLNWINIDEKVMYTIHQIALNVSVELRSSDSTLEL